jgi:hypothetical protein
MKKNFKIICIAIIIVLSFSVLSTDMFAWKGGSFGGSRGGSRGGSFGGSRGFSTPKTAPVPKNTVPSPPRSSFGGSTPSKQSGSSFGGTRLNSHSDYTQKYGTPRRTETRTFNNSQGVPQNFVVHDYGGFSSGLMTGYLMGSTSWMWSMPFHPAFYYGRPYYVNNPDGTQSVYPPTFSYTKLLLTLIILSAIIYIIYAIIRSRRRSGGSSMSKSSFG